MWGRMLKPEVAVAGKTEGKKGLFSQSLNGVNFGFHPQGPVVKPGASK